MVDIPLEEIHGLTLSKDPCFTESILHIVNIAFEDHLNVTRNKKFPGSMVSSLSKTDLSRWTGFPQCHVAYAAVELTSWMTPHVREVPQTSNHKPILSSFKNVTHARVIRRPKNTTFAVLETEFGGTDGLLTIEEFPLVSFQNIEFAGTDGCFACDLLGFII